MDIQKYEVLIKAAELGSIKKAAAELGYTQAGLSYILKTLEDEMGLHLFHRDYGKLILTAAGREILPITHHICNEQRRLCSKVSELKNLESGRITVGVFTSIAIHWLPFLMEAFPKAYPGIRIDVKWYEEKEELDEMLEAGDVDCGFSVLPDVGENFDKIFLAKDPMMIILAEDHPYASLPYFPSKAMEEIPYISGGEYSEMAELHYANGVKPVPAMVLKNDFAVMSMVSKGLGYGIFPALMMEEPPFPLAVKEPEVIFAREVGIVLRSLAEAPEAVAAFISFTKAWVNGGNKKG